MRPADFSIRPASPGYAGAILRVHRRAILILARESYSEVELQSWTYGLSEDFYRARTEDTAHFEVAENPAGLLIGFAATRQDEVWLVYVDPDWVRRGVGSALLARAERHLLDAGLKDIWVQSSLNAQAFYVAHGYVRQKSLDAATRGDVSLKALRMTKTLAPSD
ncbi:MAG: GNAT family N-acetyltransferase [Alphaproteobacteria bacterium]|nr:GNAT family N-acetyltransferase [Alphaproteobacteria bacterium]